MRLLTLLALAASLALIGAAATAAPSPTPYIGANYTHFEGGCRPGISSIWDRGIVAEWHRPGVPARVRRQLAAMRASGLDGLRTIVWNVTDARRERWGVISSAGGRPAAADETALREFFTAIRRAGFRRLLVSFGPSGANGPRDPRYTPEKLTENWRFVQRVRFLARRYGPQSISFDLMNEATPDPADPDDVASVGRYVASIYRLYVRAYGNADVSFSAIASQAPADVEARLQNLVDALLTSGQPLPRWLDVHIAYDAARAAADFEAIERTLRRNALGLALVIGEGPYEDAGTAQVVADYAARVPRRLLAVLEWPKTPGAPCQVSESPPFTADALLRAFGRR